MEIPSGAPCGPRYGRLYGYPVPLRGNGHIHGTASLSDPDHRRLTAHVLDLEHLADLGGDLPPFKCGAAIRVGAMAGEGDRDPTDARDPSQPCSRGIELELVERADTLGPPARDPAAPRAAGTCFPRCGRLS